MDLGSESGIVCPNLPHPPDVAGASEDACRPERCETISVLIDELVETDTRIKRGDGRQTDTDNGNDA
jgi:hypothetical protein